MMADAARAAQEQHRRRHARRDDHRVVAGAARHAMHRRRRCASTARSSAGDERGIHRDRRLVEPRLARRRRARAAPRSRAAASISRSTAASPHVIVGMTDVEARDTAPGDDVGGAGLGLDLSDRRDQAGCRQRLALRRRTIHSAAPASASRRASIGVVPAWLAAPVKVTSSAALSGDRVDDAERQAEALEHRSLLDVELEIAERVGSATRASSSRGGIEAEVANRVAHADAVRIAARRAASSSSVPTSARLPMNGTPKRTPSSSEKPTTSMLNGSRRPSQQLDQRDRRARRRECRRTRRRGARCRDASR